MTPHETRQAYREAMEVAGETVAVRRYEGTGLTRPRYDVNVRARVVDYVPSELVGTIQQGDRRVIMLVQDLIDAQFPIPPTANDKLMLRGKELQIVVVDDSTRRVKGTLIAYEIQARG